MKYWSKYNIFFERDNICFLYCSLSNSFAKLSYETYKDLKWRFENDIPVEDKELIDSLVKMKAINTDDEYEVMKIRHYDDVQKFSRHTLSLTINPTLACNFRCSYCFEREHQNKYMTPEIEDRVLEYAKNSTECRQIFVTWFGGEPLLGIKTIHSLTKKLLTIGKPYRAGLITNGYLLSEKIARSLKDLKIDTIQITLDGPRDTHNSRRFLAGGGKTFDTILTNIKKCQKIAPQVKIYVRVNIDESNKNGFITIRNDLISANFPNIEVYPGIVQSIDPLNQSKESKGYEIRGKSQCDICDRESVISLLVGLYNDHGFKYIDLFPKGRRFSCTARNVSSLVIGPEGEIYDCWNDVGDTEKITGYLGGKITNMKLHLQYLADASQFDDPQCMECKLLPICNGGCQRHRILNKKNLSNIDNCMLGKGHMEDFLYMHYLSKHLN